jgi:hypothetical protein
MRPRIDRRRIKPPPRLRSLAAPSWPPSRRATRLWRLPYPALPQQPTTYFALRPASRRSSLEATGQADRLRLRARAAPRRPLSRFGQAARSLSGSPCSHLGRQGQRATSEVTPRDGLAGPSRLHGQGRGAADEVGAHGDGVVEDRVGRTRLYWHAVKLQTVDGGSVVGRHRRHPPGVQATELVRIALRQVLRDSAELHGRRSPSAPTTLACPAPHVLDPSPSASARW